MSALTLGLVFLGSGIGGVLRYALSTAIQSRVGSQPTDFPLGTLTVNLVGGLLMGMMLAWFSTNLNIKEETRLAATVGLLGGFTTFSAFSKESFLLLQHGRLGTCGVYISLSVILSVLAVWGGSKLIGLIAPPSAA